MQNALLTLILLTSAMVAGRAEGLTEAQILEGRRAVQQYLQADEPAAREVALASLRALGAPGVTEFKALLSLEQRTLPETAEELEIGFAVDTLGALAELQVPSAEQAGSGLAPLMIVLLPSRFDSIEAGDELARLVGGAFQESGWIVAAPRPFQVDDELGFRSDKTRPAFIRWTRGSGELVPWLVAHLLRTLPVDPDRVHILGLEDGADGALWVVARYADRFASATAIDGRLSGRTPLRWAKNIGKVDVTLGYDVYPRDWRPGEKGALLQLLPSHGIKTTFLPVVKDDVFPAEKLIEVLDPVLRNTLDRVVRWYTDRAGYGAFQWASIDACAREARLHLEADRGTNSIDIVEASGVRALTLSVDSLVLDPRRPITVTYDGRRVYEDLPEPKVEGLMDCWHRWGDVTRLYSQSLSLEMR